MSRAQGSESPLSDRRRSLPLINWGTAYISTCAPFFVRLEKRFAAKSYSFLQFVLLQHWSRRVGDKRLRPLVDHVSNRAIGAADLEIIMVHRRAPRALTCTRARRSGASRGEPVHSRRGHARRLAVGIGSRVLERDPAVFGLK